MKDADTAGNWFYEERGKRKGPLSEQQMEELIRTGVISFGSHVWKKGFADWVSVEGTELNIYLDNSIPPPLTGERVNNTLVWVLAFAPLLGYCLEYFFAGLFGGYPHRYWYVTIILNIALSIVDERSLKKAGHDTSKYGSWAYWLVPVYLYQRAKNLKQNLAYFAVWIGCFVLVLMG